MKNESLSIAFTALGITTSHAEFNLWLTTISLGIGIFLGTIAIYDRFKK